VSTNALPERAILSALRTGIEAISHDLDLLDGILRGSITDAEIGKARTYWTDHPPNVVMGFARSDTPFPCYAVTLASDETNQDYVGQGEEADFINGEPAEGIEGNLFKRRLKGAFAIYVYTEHPDVCVWYYRVARRILSVATRYFVTNDLDEPMMQGADLAPDPRYTPENLFVRRLTLTLEYEESWDDHDALWEAFYGEGSEQRLTANGTLVIAHEDSGGGVHPYDPESE
jgi:hypothetical protein